jgi:hypothetical protein
MCTTASGTAPRLTHHDSLEHAYTEREMAACRPSRLSRVEAERRAA